jgi:hypothetical protein
MHRAHGAFTVVHRARLTRDGLGLRLFMTRLLDGGLLRRGFRGMRNAAVIRHERGKRRGLADQPDRGNDARE